MAKTLYWAYASGVLSLYRPALPKHVSIVTMGGEMNASSSHMYTREYKCVQQASTRRKSCLKALRGSMCIDSLVT